MSDGVLPPVVWGTGLAVAGTAVALASRRLDEKTIPQVAVLSAVFFVATLIHVPVPLTSIHLSLSGLLGIVLGWLSLPAVFVAILFQAVFLHHGGLAAIGVNTLTMGAGSIASWLVFVSLERTLLSGGRAPAAAFIAAAAGAVASAAVFVLAMALGGEGLLQVALLCLVPSLLLAIVEGVVTASTVAFLLRAKPELVPGFDRRRPRRAARCAATATAAAAVLAVLAPAPASAHDLEATARIAGGKVRIEAFFSGGEPAPGARVTVRERTPGAAGPAAGGPIVAEGRTDEGGAFEFVPRGEAGLHVVISDPLGHRSEMEIPASSLRGAPGPAAPADEGGLAPPIASTGAGDLPPLWLRAAAGIAAIAVLAAAAWAILRWRRPRAP